MLLDIPISPFKSSIPMESTRMVNKNFDLSDVEFETLLSELESGNEALFERIFVKKYWKFVHRLQASHGINQADAEDAVMDGLLQFRKILLSRKVIWGNLEAYLTRIIVTDFQKKQKRIRETSVESFDENMADADILPQFSTEELAAFKKAWDSLCDKCSTVLRKFYYDEMPHHRIAELLNKRVDAIKQDKHRCIEKLRKNFFLNPV